jgi:hypothetical protein
LIRVVTWRPGYAVAALCLFLIEVLIALFVHDQVIRPHIGDVLAVILVYLGLRAVSRIAVIPGAALAFAIGCLIEIGQGLDLLGRLGLAGNVVARTVLGSQFDWRDILAYAAGAVAAVLVERLRSTRRVAI